MKITDFSKYKNIYVVSPHFDDAALSCGSLLMLLKGKANITVVNIFTRAHSGPYTLSAKKFLRDTGGFTSATELFEQREKLDHRALSSLDLRIINLKLIDSLFRKKRQNSFVGKIIPELNHLYPIYRIHVLNSFNVKDTAPDLLKKNLKKIVGKNDLVIAPFGIGNHVDHRIARKTCEECFENLVLYSDFPYNIRKGYYGEAPNGYERLDIKPDYKEKERLLKLYKTQFGALFPNKKLPNHKEVYFVKRK